MNPRILRELSQSFMKNDTIFYLNLSANDFHLAEEEGIKFLCQSLKENKSINHLNLSSRGNFSNLKGIQHMELIAELFQTNKNIQTFNFSWQNFGHCQLQDLKLFCESLFKNSSINVLVLQNNFDRVPTKEK